MGAKLRICGPILAEGSVPDADGTSCLPTIKLGAHEVQLPVCHQASRVLERKSPNFEANPIGEGATTRWAEYPTLRLALGPHTLRLVQPSAPSPSWASMVRAAGDGRSSHKSRRTVSPVDAGQRPRRPSVRVSRAEIAATLARPLGSSLRVLGETKNGALRKNRRTAPTSFTLHEQACAGPRFSTFPWGNPRERSNRAPFDPIRPGLERSANGPW